MRSVVVVTQAVGHGRGMLTSLLNPVATGSLGHGPMATRDDQAGGGRGMKTSTWRVVGDQA